ncbi:MAG: MFS transporter [Oscillospiraceae bacterium]|nr:MFS transporter [Oscillospiraceae bacterium]
MVPTSAFLLHRFSTKHLYIGAMAFFLAGTVIAAGAGSFPLLLTGRMVQAIGTGLLAPIMINTALAIYPREKHGLVMGICTCVILVGPSVSPIVAGVVLQYFSWRTLFIMLLPFTLLCIAAAARVMGSALELTHPRLDGPSVLGSSLGFALLVGGMSSIGSGLPGAATILLFAAGLLSLWLFGRRQLRLQQPMLDIRAFQKPYFSLGAVLVLTIQMDQFSLNILLPLLFEEGQGLSSLSSALLLLPAVLICSVMTVAAGKLYDQVGGKVLIPLGLLVMTVGLALLGQVQPGTALNQVALLNTLIYFGISLAWSPNQSNALRQLPGRRQADGVAILNTLIQLGSAIGTPLFVGLLSSGQSRYLKNSAEQSAAATVAGLYAGFRLSVRVGAAIIAAALLLSLALWREKAGKPQPAVL